MTFHGNYQAESRRLVEESRATKGQSNCFEEQHEGSFWLVRYKLLGSWNILGSKVLGEEWWSSLERVHKLSQGCVETWSMMELASENSGKDGLSNKWYWEDWLFVKKKHRISSLSRTMPPNPFQVERGPKDAWGTWIILRKKERRSLWHQHRTGPLRQRKEKGKKCNCI